MRNRLREANIQARRPYVGPPLNQARRIRLMAWLTACPQKTSDEVVEKGPFYLSLFSLFSAQMVGVGRTEQKDTESPEYPHHSRPVDKCIFRRMEHFNDEDQYTPCR